MDMTKQRMKNAKAPEAEKVKIVEPKEYKPKKVNPIDTRAISDNHLFFRFKSMLSHQRMSWTLKRKLKF